MILKRVTFYCFLLTIGLHQVYGQEKIIKTGDEWQYYDKSDAPEEGWEEHANLKGNWKTGISPLGYRGKIEATEISYGDDPENKNIAYYFKKSFRIENPYEYLIYELNYQRDDGIVIYLNGNEIVRNNMPEGVITNRSLATGLISINKEEQRIHTKLLSPDDLIIGKNTISVSVHQGRIDSTDMLFNLELIGNNDTNMIPFLLKERTVKNLNLDLKLKELNHKRDIEQKDIQLGFLQESKNDFKIGVYIISVLFLFSILGLGYLFWFLRKKITTHTKTIDDLKEIITGKDRKLMSSSLSTVHNQQFLKELKDSLTDSVAESDAMLKKEVKSTIRKIDYNIDNDEEWLNLLNHFNSVHYGYIDRLLKLHPTLSETEQRHCIFIKLHMQTKEIAQILHIDPRSVQASRYRIKKKMELNDTINLISYLQEF